MKRRDFLKTSAIGLAAPSALMSEGSIQPNLNDPLILSTWEHGLPANDAAWAVMKKGGSAIDAAEAGAKVPEADPKSTSVGFGGLPDEQGNVTLDACVMDSTGKCGIGGLTCKISDTQYLWREKSWKRRNTSCWWGKEQDSSLFPGDLKK